MWGNIVPAETSLHIYKGEIAELIGKLQLASSNLVH